MKTVKLNDEQAKVVREFTEYANELYEHYYAFAKTLRSLNDSLKDLDRASGLLWLLACELDETRKLRVNEENVLYDRADTTDEAGFIDIMLGRLYAVTNYSSLVEPYIRTDLRKEIYDLCYKMRKVAVTILK